MWDTIPVQDPPRAVENLDLGWWLKQTAERIGPARSRAANSPRPALRTPAGEGIGAPPGASR